MAKAADVDAAYTEGYRDGAEYGSNEGRREAMRQMIGIMYQTGQA